MSSLVVDASVAVKWFDEKEQYSEAARRLWLRDEELVAPEIIHVEVAHALARKVRRSILTADEMAEGLKALTLALRSDQFLNLIPAACEIALAYDRSVYDAIYVALALGESCQLVTADERLYNALHSAFPGTMLWIGDVPE